MEETAEPPKEKGTTISVTFSPTVSSFWPLPVQAFASIPPLHRLPGADFGGPDVDSMLGRAPSSGSLTAEVLFESPPHHRLGWAASAASQHEVLIPVILMQPGVGGMEQRVRPALRSLCSVFQDAHHAARTTHYGSLPQKSQHGRPQDENRVVHFFKNLVTPRTPPPSQGKGRGKSLSRFSWARPALRHASGGHCALGSPRPLGRASGPGSDQSCAPLLQGAEGQKPGFGYGSRAADYKSAHKGLKGQDTQSTLSKFFKLKAAALRPATWALLQTLPEARLRATRGEHRIRLDRIRTRQQEWRHPRGSFGMWMPVGSLEESRVVGADALWAAPTPDGLTSCVMERGRRQKGRQ
ncbi:hypothetical protein QTO34_002172 [Cnephaeus nilssonii]|uniref:Myelin basic protein n=1 Tax=Cnephaeus nilssonii TaxID=3371016 RepID=A0AA40HUG7_CNENI|nr:hypothetical protein QTO34_002172 [Eptesicus nilssonii]